MSAARPGVLLDRDGTVLDELGYLGRPEEVRYLTGAREAVAALNAAALPVAMVTNQSGVARGLFDEDDLARVHARIDADLSEVGARIDAWFHCPHHPDVGAEPYRCVCRCRKPAPGMFLDAVDALGLDPARSFAVGDAERDLDAARAAGIGHLLLVRTGKGATTERTLGADDVLAFDDLAQAARWILARVEDESAQDR